MQSPEDGEQQPLLRKPVDERQSSRKSRLWGRVHDLNEFMFNNPILLATFCIQFLNYFAKHMVEVPTLRLIEQAICNHYYASRGDVRERYCKVPDIQTELAAITGLKITFDALPGLLTALFYGSIADRFGRRLVLALSVGGTLCSYLWILFICYADLNLPVKLVWVSSVFLCVGGSQRVAKSMNFTVVADSTEASQR